MGRDSRAKSLAKKARAFFYWTVAYTLAVPCTMFLALLIVVLMFVAAAVAFNSVAEKLHDELAGL